MCQVQLRKQFHSRRKSSDSVRLGCFKADKTKWTAAESAEDFVSVRAAENLCRHFIYSFYSVFTIGSYFWDKTSENIQEFYFFRPYESLKVEYLCDISRSFFPLTLPVSSARLHLWMRNINILTHKKPSPLWVSHHQRRRKRPGQNTSYGLTITINHKTGLFLWKVAEYTTPKYAILA